MNILVVDDEKPVRDTFCRIILKEGHRVNQAKDGEDALDCLRNGKYDAVLLDMQMPKMNGVEVLRHIKSMNNAPPPPE